MRRKLSWALLAVICLTGPALAQNTGTPLPPGFAASEAGVEGLFAHAEYSGLLDGQPYADYRNAEQSCRAKGTILRSDGPVPPLDTREYWLYRSGTELALFERAISLLFNTDDCVVERVEHRSVTRSTGADVSWPGKFGGAPTRCGRCQAVARFDLRVRCGGSGGELYFALHTCFVTERGIARGLRVLQTFASDDGQYSNFEVDALDVAARVDAAVFDPSRPWPSPEPATSR
ncbi:MAG TPA: hypothetical protein VFX89_05925 [Gammaproteobacteria bacterium]|nr:hypothetical protein [Gammaproteobacteria bacterium]